MNVRTLEYLVALRRTGSVQMAAQYCNVTAGTVSGQVTRLEDYLGVQIFTSRAYPAQLNPEAEELFALVEDVVEALDTIKEQARALRSSDGR